MPEFIRFYAMKGGKIISFQKKINGSGKISLACK
jgi:hypothetical protein